MVRGVHTPDIRVVINETPNKWQSMARRSFNDKNTFMTGSARFPRLLSQVLMNLPSRTGRLHALESRTVTRKQSVKKEYQQDATI